MSAEHPPRSTPESHGSESEHPHTPEAGAASTDPVSVPPSPEDHTAANEARERLAANSEKKPEAASEPKKEKYDISKSLPVVIAKDIPVAAGALANPKNIFAFLKLIGSWIWMAIKSAPSMMGKGGGGGGHGGDDHGGGHGGGHH